MLAIIKLQNNNIKKIQKMEILISLVTFVITYVIGCYVALIWEPAKNLREELDKLADEIDKEGV